jgi:hypothetical protein
MAIRIALMALLLFSGVALAAPKPGGPVRGAMTIGESKLAVDVSWLQDGGVVLLKIVTAEPIPEAEREARLEAAKKLFAAKPGSRVTLTKQGQIMAMLKLTGWKKPFTADAITGQTGP